MTRANRSPILTALAFLAVSLTAAAAELVHVDRGGVIRWTSDNREVALFGANYSLPSASDYRAAGYVGADRKKLVEQDLTHFARMGWDGMRLCLWGDWENSDAKGNLVVNDHLDLLDYAIAEAKKRGIYILFTPITTYGAWWPDGKETDNYPGFSKTIEKAKLGTDAGAIAVQQNYLRQILEHVNPYTGVALKDEPQILFVEMINEPTHHPEDPAGSVAYINALADAVRSTGCRKILFHNLSQDFRMTPMIAAARVDGLSFAWYPTALIAGHTRTENYLRWVDEFTPMLGPDIPTMPRIVYEFDSADQNSGYMYPAMVRAFREAGAQMAAMFSYDMLATAPYNLGWQTHFLNLVYSPRKAVSAIIAAEAMRELPRGGSYGAYPANRQFGPVRVSYENDSSELLTAEKFFYAGDTTSMPRDVATLRHVVGCGSSTVVGYEGTGSYFLDRLAEGQWRLEVYPDAVIVQDPFAQQQNRATVSSRLIAREWPMTLRLPDLGESFSVSALNAGNPHQVTAQSARFPVRPGVYLLSVKAEVDRRQLPQKIGELALDEFVCPTAPELPLQIVSHTAPVQMANNALVAEFELVSSTLPESATLRINTGGPNSTPRDFALSRIRGYTWRATVPPGTYAAGELDLSVSIPGTQDAPQGKVRVITPGQSLAVFDAREDGSRLSAMRLSGDQQPNYFEVQKDRGGKTALILRAPSAGDALPALHAVSLPIKTRIQQRGPSLKSAQSIRVTLRGHARSLRLSLVEADGATWSVVLPVTPTWQAIDVPTTEFQLGAGVKLPLGYPANWNYRLTPPLGRGGPDDALQIERVEHVQFTAPPTANATGDDTVEIAAVEAVTNSQ